MKGESEWRPGHELKSLASLPRLIPEAKPPEAEPPRTTHKNYLYSEPVVGSEQIKWKPIDVVAARVVAKAPWWAEPPVPKPVFEQKQMSIQFPEPGRLKSHRRLDPTTGTVEEMFKLTDVAPLAIMEHEKNVSDGIDQSADLVKRAHDVVDACDYMVNHFSEPFNEYQGAVKKHLQSVREQRMAIEGETRQLMTALREVRTFFMDKDYELERARLAEFVQLCERLQRLKESGFLDTVAETMLNIAEGRKRE